MHFPGRLTIVSIIKNLIQASFASFSHFLAIKIWKYRTQAFLAILSGYQKKSNGYKYPFFKFPGKHYLFIIICLTLTFLTCAGCNKKIVPIHRTRVLMGTYVTISVFDRDMRVRELTTAIDSAFNKIKKIEKLVSYRVENSQLNEINEKAGISPTAVDSHLVKILKVSQRISQLSDGAFDITIAPIEKLWGFNSDNYQVPNQEAINQELIWVDWKKIKFDSNLVELPVKGMSIDLGGIAKGYIVDEAVRILQSFGISDAQVDAGGDLRTIATRLTAGKRRVWIRHPRNDDAFYGYFRMDEGSVATSGDYERYFFSDSVRYHHILSPQTGYPARSCVSVTIMGPSTIECDALATAVFVLGPSKGMSLIQQLPEFEAVIIFETSSGLNHVISSGLKKNFTCIDDND